ncbi:MAG: BsuPI-related putative proteinase inhibitor [Gemmatimonadota bacterium]|nr:BsuPI-related putative proteinase inhibitor [Gemmatimonadota bacterium]
MSASIAAPSLQRIAAKPALRTKATTHRKAAPPEVHLITTLDAKATRGGAILTLTVVNTGRSHVELNFPSGQTHDVAVSDSAGREVWRWSTSRMFTQGIQNRLIGAGSKLTFVERWEPADAPHGHFTAVGVVQSSNHRTEARTTFVLP